MAGWAKSILYFRTRRFDGTIDTRTRAEGLLPIALAHGAVLRTDVPRDAPVLLDAVEIDESSEIVALRRRQDVLIDDALRSASLAGRRPQ